ncbi:hypothetical protein [Halovulum sp. GXIMD14793]
MKRTVTIFATIVGIILAGPAAADRFLTKEKLSANPAAYRISLGNGEIAQVNRIQPPRGVGKSCKVDMKSLERLARKEFRKPRSTTAISVPIHMALVMPGKDSPFFEPTCYGAGGGCTIWVLKL